MEASARLDSWSIHDICIVMHWRKAFIFGIHRDSQMCKMEFKGLLFDPDIHSAVTVAIKELMAADPGFH